MLEDHVAMLPVLSLPGFQDLLVFICLGCEDDGQFVWQVGEWLVPDKLHVGECSRVLKENAPLTRCKCGHWASAHSDVKRTCLARGCTCRRFRVPTRPRRRGP